MKLIVVGKVCMNQVLGIRYKVCCRNDASSRTVASVFFRQKIIQEQMETPKRLCNGCI